MNNTWTAAERCFAVSSSAVEAVVVVLITDLVEAQTLRVLHTLRLCLFQTEFIVNFAVPSSKGDICWWPRVIWVALPESAHKSCSLSPFPDLYPHTILFFLDVNPKASHLSCA